MALEEIFISVNFFQVSRRIVENEEEVEL